MRKGFSIFLFVIFVTTLVIGYFSYQYLKRLEISQSQTDQSQQSSPLDPPGNLTLPVKPFDISTNRGVINPFGVVRWSKDMAGTGHPGIDLPTSKGGALYAVFDGKVIDITPETDGYPGNDIKLLIKKGEREGEGWIFLYEQAEPVTGILKGSEVKKGDLIARSPLNPEIANHLQLTYTFNNYEYFKDHKCWVDYLNPVSKKVFLEYWENIIAKQDHLRKSWDSANEEGFYQFKQLLDIDKFPSGPQLCYPQGTDVRIPVDQAQD